MATFKLIRRLVVGLMKSGVAAFVRWKVDSKATLKRGGTLRYGKPSFQDRRRWKL